jgi:HEAT repeat protein
MRPMIVCVVALGVLGPAARAEPVEEWQVRGTLAALKDGYPQVRLLAASELEDLLRPDPPGGPRREWQGQSASLIDGARGDLRELLKDTDPDLHTAAARALALLYERAKDVAALRELLLDAEARAGYYAAESLARLYERAGDVSALRGMLNDADPNASWSGYQALARLYEGRKDAAALRGLLGDTGRSGRWYAAQALARLYEGSKDVAGLREMLKDGSPDVRREAAAALAHLGEKDATPLLREFLKDARPNVREHVAEAITSAAERGKDAAGLRDLLKDSCPEVGEKAAEALARLYAATKNTIGLRELLKDANPDARREAAQALAHVYESAKDGAALRDLLQSTDPDAVREAAWALVRLAQAEDDKAALRGLLQAPDATVSREAAWALGRLGDREMIPALRELLKDPNADARRETALVLTRLGDADLPAVLRLPYEDVSYLYWARWLAYYWGGKRPEVARVLCAYLGRPKEPPAPPVPDGKSRNEAALADIRVLREEVWEKTESPWMKEDVAGWWSSLITQEGVGWKSADEPELRRVRDALANEPFGRRYVPAIDRAMEPLETFPSPLVRTGLVFVFLNLLAVLLALVGRRLGGRGRWLPLGVCLGGVLLVVIADVAGWEYRARTVPWLLALASLAEVGVLLGFVAVSPAGSSLGALPRPTPRSGGRRTDPGQLAAAVGARLRDDRDRAGYEEYVALPADVRSESHLEPTACDDPAGVILARLTGTDGPKGSVLIEAPAGTGKSALVREVVSRALDRFKQDPASQPLAVVLDGGGESVETMVQALGPPPALQEAGRLILILDGASEAGPAAEVLAAFVNGPNGHGTPLLVAARPGHGYVRALGGARWVTVEPKALDAESLGRFTAGYGGPTFPDAVLAACRGPGGGYVPRLVRMAMVVNPRGDDSFGIADLYRAYFLKSLEGQLPAEADRVKRLDEASRWCLDTHWRDGRRRRRYDATDPLQRQLRQAGLIVAAGAGPEPKVAVFADATMQSYLTAHALAAQDRQGYAMLPRPADASGAAWDRRRVLARAAADTELFRLCLATFTPQKELRQWLRDEAARAGKALDEAVRAGFEADEKADSVEALGSLFAEVAAITPPP